MGYLMLDRKFFDHFFWKEKRKFNRAEAWLDLIQLVSYSNGKSQIINGSLVEYDRGQYPISLSFLMKRWSWSTNKVRTYLSTLERTGQITRQITSGITILTLCNYDVYNGEAQTEGQAEGKAEGQADGKVTEGIKEIKNFNKPRKEINIPFEVFWNLYDKKTGKVNTVKLWQRLSDLEREECMEKLPAYISSKPDKVYRKDPATFLRNKSWNDEIFARRGQPVNGGKPKSEARRMYEEILLGRE